MNQEEKAFASKKKVLTAAATLFTQKGYESTTMQDIMTESGLSKGAIYYHFKSKQEILSTMVTEAQERINTFIREVAEDDRLSVEGKIKHIIEYFYNNENQRLLILNRWVEKAPYSLLGTIRNGHENIAPQIAKIIEQGVQNGELHCTCPLELSEVLLLLDVWLDPVITERTSEEVCKRLEFLFGMLEHFGAPLFEASDMESMKRMYSNYSTKRDEA